MTRILILCAALTLAGCASIGTAPTLDNAPACEVGRQRAYVVSMFGWLGLSFKLTPESAQAMCPKPA
jgi:hypothetical protein